MHIREIDKNVKLGLIALVVVSVFLAAALFYRLRSRPTPEPAASTESCADDEAGDIRFVEQVRIPEWKRRIEASRARPQTPLPQSSVTNAVSAEPARSLLQSPQPEAAPVQAADMVPTSPQAPVKIERVSPPPSVTAQRTTIELTDGSRLGGVLVSQDKRKAVIEVRPGVRYEIPQESVKIVMPKEESK